MPQIQLTSLAVLSSHTRFILTLRSQEGLYRSLILFRLSAQAEHNESRNIGSHLSQNRHLDLKQIYVMESTCPHLGADLSHAEIEECESSVIAVCPWHRYDFDLKTGESGTGLRVCTYSVEVKDNLADGVSWVYMELPTEGRGWRVTDLRPVSEEFSDSPNQVSKQLLPVTLSSQDTEKPDEPVVPDIDPPTTLLQWAVLILNTPNPTLKVQRTRHAVSSFLTGKLRSIGHRSQNPPCPPDVPKREIEYSRNVIDSGKMKSRKNRAVMLHALANIEQWAIDLAWDIIARFGPLYPDLPPAFFADFAKMALDESKHFTLLTSRLSDISPSTLYGTLPVHASLWESARVTFSSLRSRLAIIHLVHEARGLDVNPVTIERFRKAGDLESVSVMEIIHVEEVTHVTTGHRWFTWVCQRDGGLDPVKSFREEVQKYWRGAVKGPFNVADRERAGLTREFYEDLKGEIEGAPRVSVEFSATG